MSKLKVVKETFNTVVEQRYADRQAFLTLGRHWVDSVFQPGDRVKVVVTRLEAARGRS